MKDIRNLINKYLDERMSLAEEQEFFHHLRSTDVPPEMRDAKEFILQLAEMQEETPPPAEIEERLTAAIDAWQKEEKQINRKTSLTALWRAAAIIIITLGGIFAAVWQKNCEEKYTIAQETDTFSTPEEALPYATTIIHDLTTAMNITHNSATKLKKDIILLNNILNKQQP